MKNTQQLDSHGGGRHKRRGRRGNFRHYMKRLRARALRRLAKTHPDVKKVGFFGYD